MIVRPSPNFGERRDGKKPVMLIMHYTDTKAFADTVNILTDPDREVSAHYAVDLDGTIVQLVDEEKRAWHAGKSFWAGETDVNSASIGIEIQNYGHQFGYRNFPAPQMKAVLELSQGIIKRWGILPQNVLAHSDIAPGRKKDPGELFPWAWLAENGVGLWPRATEGKKAGDIKKLLIDYGYDHGLDIKILLEAFQRHFEPEAFRDNAVGVLTERTLHRINSLLAQKTC